MTWRSYCSCSDPLSNTDQGQIFLVPLGWNYFQKLLENCMTVFHHLLDVLRCVAVSAMVLLLVFLWMRKTQKV